MITIWKAADTSDEKKRLNEPTLTTIMYHIANAYKVYNTHVHFTRFRFLQGRSVAQSTAMCALYVLLAL